MGRNTLKDWAWGNGIFTNSEQMDHIEYLPKSNKLWILFPISENSLHLYYCTWFDTRKNALSYIGYRAICGDIHQNQPIPFRYSYDGAVKLFFDLSNGDSISKRYVWFCRDNEGLEELGKSRRSVKQPSTLSMSIRYSEI